jgi:polyhydroxyalkanoate synthesis regulator phasin
LHLVLNQLRAPSEIMMNPFSNIVQKAFYLGMGLASVAGEKAGTTLNELRTQASKLAEELVEKGEMSTDEAKKFVDDLIRQSQKTPDRDQIKTGENVSSPRSINIDDDSSAEQTDEANDLEAMRAKVQQLQDQLRNIQ